MAYSNVVVHWAVEVSAVHMNVYIHRHTSTGRHRATVQRRSSSFILCLNILLSDSH